MSSTIFINGQTVIDASWANDVNVAVYTAIGDGTNSPVTAANVKTNLGLNLLDNTSDANKPVSTATQTALNLKQDVSTAVTITGVQTLTNKTLSTPIIDTHINYSGSSGVIQIGGVDKVTVGSQGIEAGSYAPSSITATELAAGALVETSPTSLLGYDTGAGGTVTQATSKSTAVTLNKPCGQITMNAAALAAGANVVFTLNNTLVLSSDNILLGASGNGNYRVEVHAILGGQLLVRVTNITAGSLSEALVINFAIIKGATA